METTETTQQEVVNKTYEYAANLMVQQKKSAEEVKQALGHIHLPSATHKPASGG
jgi:hypothetical protein